MKYYILLLAVLVSIQLQGQIDIIEHVATPADHWSYLQQFSTQTINDERYISDARSKGFDYGTTFQLAGVSDFQFQFQVLTNKRYGKLKKRIYLGVFEVTDGVPNLIYSRDEDLVKLKNSSSIRALVQVVQIDTSKEYVVLVAGHKLGKSFTVRTAQRFIPNPTRMVNANGPTYEETKSIIGKLWLANTDTKSTRKITLKTITGEIIEVAVPDERGHFKFENLPFEESFLVELDETDYSLEASIHLFDQHGDLINKGQMNASGEFAFNAINAQNDVKLLDRSDYSVYPSANKTSVAGKIVDQKTMIYGQPGINVQLLDPKGKVMDQTSTDARGNFYFIDIEFEAFELRINDNPQNYLEAVVVNDKNVPFKFTNSRIALELKGLFFKAINKEEVDQAMRNEVAFESSVTNFKSLESGRPIILKHVSFNTNEATMEVSSYSELGQLHDLLTQEKNLKLVIIGHTDNKGNKQHNIELSQRRAQSIADYLVDKGIPSSSITTIGKGSKSPISSNMSATGRSQNRRVEVMLIR